MERAAVWLKDDLARVQLYLQSVLDAGAPLIGRVGEHLLGSGGKRIRPMLLLLCARLCGYRGEARIALAGVVELLHMATLLHDDVVDEAAVRRGRVSANVTWGNQAAVLVGDYLFARCFSLAVAEGNLRLAEVLAAAAGRMAEGEVLQLMNRRDVQLDEDRYLDVVIGKTAALFAASCRLGAILAARGGAEEEALAAFGLRLGMAFQLLDDVLDYVAAEADSGKLPCHDLAEGKLTLPLIYALRCCRPEERQRVAEILARRHFGEPERRFIIGLILQHDGIGYTRRRARQMVREGRAHLASFAADPVRDALGELAESLLARRG